MAPHTHEANAYLNYAPKGDDYDGLDPYWAISNLYINEFDGWRKLKDVEIEGERWDIRINRSTCGIAARPSDSVDGALYEFDITMRGPGRTKVSFNLSPRYESMRNPDGDSISMAWDHLEHDEGIAVYVQASNVNPDRFPSLLARSIFELADSADVGLYHGYFDAPASGRLTDLERYVRILRSMSEKLVGAGGLLDRISMRLSDAKGTKGRYRFDNEEIKGHHHTIKHQSTAARELISHHSLGGQEKVYLPEHPEKFESDDALYHPKFGVKYAKKQNKNGAVDWDQRHDVIQELDERLLSILSWAGIPTEAGGTTYVVDDHFDAAPAEESVAIHADPLPKLEANQEHLLMTCLRDMTPAGQEIAEVVATDGGQHVEDVADATDTSLSTVYRVLQRMDGVLESDNGHVQFVSEALRKEVRGIVQSVEHAIESAADRAAELVSMDLRQSASSAFDKWMARYGADIDWPEHDGGQVRVRLDTLLSTMNDDRPSPEQAIAEMYEAWETDGRHPKALDGGLLEADTYLSGRTSFRVTPP
ncbi:hypothetical protein ACFQH8_15690 [Halomicroarcula sp. GCM10025710]